MGDVTPADRQRIIDAFAAAMYACAFQRAIEESDDVEAAWRLWRDEAETVLNLALRVDNG